MIIYMQRSSIKKEGAMNVASGLMSIIFILYSIVLFVYGISSYWQSKPLRRWNAKKTYYLFTVCSWAVGHLMMGVAGFWGGLIPVAKTIYGLSFILMIFAPCSMPIFNENTTLKVVRGFSFALVGALQFL